MTLRLGQLIQDLPIRLALGDGQIPITGISDDTRTLKEGDLFILRGNGRFVSDAVQCGAAAILIPESQSGLAMPSHRLPFAVTEPGVPVDQRLCGKLAERFYGHPSRQLKLIGVTGTNGKTTTVTITKHLLESAGHKCGLIGTVELDTGSPEGPRPATLTTPGAIELSRLLREMVDNGLEYCAMEVSSHALHQGRADHLRFAAAAFTNLTQDHLDYHGTMEAYADAKAILFEGLDADAVAVLNAADPYSERMAKHCQAKLLLTTMLRPGRSGAVAIDLDQDVHCVIPWKIQITSSTAAFTGPWCVTGVSWRAELPLPGEHNLFNAQQAVALAYAAAGLDAEQIKTGLETCRPVPGRLEPIGAEWPNPPSPVTDLPAVLVDYAHTPDALENVGKALRELTTSSGGRLITLFGCGGDRDRAKRPLMAKAAQQYADVVVLTSDNPRTEDPQQILDDAAQEFAHADAEQREASGTEHHIIMDRAEAIRFAINLANENDTVLIAGKGHEDYQILGTEKVHFDDREQAAAALREKIGQA